MLGSSADRSFMPSYSVCDVTGMQTCSSTYVVFYSLVSGYDMFGIGNRMGVNGI